MSYKLLGIETALRRLPKSHTKIPYLQQQVNIINAGINGEKSLDALFENDAFYENYFVFQDLNLKSTGLFQIDYLYINAYFAIIFEVKNISGNISISIDNPRLKRTLSNGQIDYFRNPLRQIVETNDLFNDFLGMHGFELPIYQAIVFKQSNHALDIEKTSIPILSVRDVPSFIRSRARKNKVLSPVQLVDLVELLLKKHRDYIPFPISTHYDIPFSDFQKGIQCEMCNKFGMIKMMRGWFCRNCGSSSKTAHIDAVRDFCILINPNITNEQCRTFLKIGETKVASRILKNMNLSLIGSNRKRVYHMNYSKIKRDFDGVSH